MTPSQSKKNIISISRAYFLLFLVLTIAFLVGFGAIWMYSKISDFNQESQNLRSDFIEHQKDILVQKSEECINFIKYQNTQAESRLKNRLKNFVDQSHAVAMHIYKQNKGKASDKEIKRRIKEAITPVRFTEGRGYVFINTLGGKGVLYPFSKENEGASLINFQDVNKNYIVKNKYNAYTKVSYIKKFVPYNWYFGSFAYLDDLQDEIQNEALVRINQISLGEGN